LAIVIFGDELGSNILSKLGADAKAFERALRKMLVKVKQKKRKKEIDSFDGLIVL
jgi:hypothetical protein